MNVLISICESFLYPAKVMLYSLSRHNKGEHIYLLYSSLSEEKREELKEFVTNVCEAEFTAICADGFFENVPLSQQYQKKELYFRLLAPYLLPKELDRILYLDADLVVQKSLKGFYEQDLGGAYIAVVKDRFDFCKEVVLQKQRLGMTDEDVYFNSGVMLMDLAALREHLPFSMIQEFIEEKREELVYFDQDILNRLLLSHKKVCDVWYNFQAYPMEEIDVEKVIQESYIIHYTDLPKPWLEEVYKGEIKKVFYEVENEMKACLAM